MTAILVSEPETVVHVYAHADGPRRAEAAAEIAAMWARCHDLGLTSPVPRLGLPVDPPESPPVAVQRPDTHAQAVLRRHHDVWNLSMFAGPPGTTWEWQEDLLSKIVDTPSPGVFGTAWLRLGKQNDAAVTGGRLLAPGIVLRETPTGEDTRAERRLTVLAPEDRDDELSDWTWSDGGIALPPLARYLLHTAKLRYQLRVHAALRPASELCLCMQDALADADHERSRAARFAVAHRLTLLKTMRRTVEIAAANATVALGPGADGVGDPVDDDRALAEFFLQRLDDDITYLDMSAEGAREMTDLLPSEVRSPPEPTFGIVTALPEEFAAVRFLLADERRVNVAGDRANYYIGTVPSAEPEKPHRVVVTLLGETANNAAADGCANLIRSFDAVNCVVMCGIAAGVPAVTEPRKHVRLGDIVVASWGIVDYDHVVDRPDGVEQRQSHPRPSPVLKHASNLLDTGERMGDRPWERYIDAVVADHPEFARPPSDTDVVHRADDDTTVLPHPDSALSGHRLGRPKVHHGVIGSADRALRNLTVRDELAARHDLRAFEMEGTGIGKAGFAGGIEWYVVRGVSDYGDARTDHRWRNHAALVAAAYVKALLGECALFAARGGHTIGSSGRT